MMREFTECSQSARHCSKCSPCSNSFNKQMPANQGQTEKNEVYATSLRFPSKGILKFKCSSSLIQFVVYQSLIAAFDNKQANVWQSQLSQIFLMMSFPSEYYNLLQKDQTFSGKDLYGIKTQSSEQHKLKQHI